MSRTGRGDGDPPELTRLRELCLALPGAKETLKHSGPSFSAGRVFASYGGFVRDTDGAARRVPSAFVFFPDPVDLPAIDADPRFFVPVYHGERRATDLASPALDWTEIAELVDASYRQVAPAHLVRALDARDTDRRA